MELKYKKKRNIRYILSEYSKLLGQIPPDIKSKAEGVIKGYKFVEWYYSPNEALEGEAPHEVARTRKGKKIIKSLLGRLEWGIFE